MTQVGNHKRLSIHRGWKIQRRNVDTLQGTNISHLGKRKIIFKMPFLRDMLVSWRVYFLIFHRDLQLCLFSDLEQLEQPTFLICKECPNLTSVGSNQKPFKKKSNTPGLFNPYGVSSTGKVSPAHVNRVWLGYPTISIWSDGSPKQTMCSQVIGILWILIDFQLQSPSFFRMELFTRLFCRGGNCSFSAKNNGKG